MSLQIEWLILIELNCENYSLQKWQTMNWDGSLLTPLSLYQVYRDAVEHAPTHASTSLLTPLFFKIHFSFILIGWIYATSSYLDDTSCGHLSEMLTSSWQIRQKYRCNLVGLKCDITVVLNLVTSHWYSNLRISKTHQNVSKTRFTSKHEWNKNEPSCSS